MFIVLGLILKELECEHTFEDISLLQLLREHCLLGAFENFDYLLKARIMDKKDQNLLKILEARDKDGRTLLHHAAEGGSKDIFKSLRKVCPQLSVADTAAYGYTVLHLACKKENMTCVHFYYQIITIKIFWVKNQAKDGMQRTLLL